MPGPSLATIDNGKVTFDSFLSSPSTGKIDSITKFSVIEVHDFLFKVSMHNSKTTNTRVEKIGVYNSLVGNVITSYLVALDAAGNIIRGGGAGGDGSPHLT